MSKEKIGPTGSMHPNPAPNDKGGLNVGVGPCFDRGRVRVEFGTTLTFVEMTPDEADAFAVVLTRAAAVLRERKRNA